MATKMITRTLTTYRYTFGKFNPVTMSMGDIQQTVSVFKLNRKELKVWTEKGYVQLAMQEVDTLYGISMEDFLKHAKVLDPNNRKAMEGLEVVDQ